MPENYACKTQYTHNLPMEESPIPLHDEVEEATLGLIDKLSM
jgi:hypothetical protein